VTVVSGPRVDPKHLHSRFTPPSARAPVQVLSYRSRSPLQLARIAGNTAAFWTLVCGVAGPQRVTADLLEAKRAALAPWLGAGGDRRVTGLLSDSVCDEVEAFEHKMRKHIIKNPQDREALRTAYPQLVFPEDECE
jgi:hypothetical protein